MKSKNSDAEFVLGLLKAQLEDCALSYPALAKEFIRDYTRLSSAIEHHGVRFALDSMPAWRKHFDSCLAQGRLTPSHLTNFGVLGKGSVIPRLLRGLTLRVFDHNGSLKRDPDIQAIRFIRQILGSVRKFQIACGPKNNSDAVREFIRTDLEVSSGSLNWESNDPFEKEELDKLSFTDRAYTPSSHHQGSFLPGFEVHTLNYGHALQIQRVADLLCTYLGVFSPSEHAFRHGPGAVSDLKSGAYKYAFENWPDRLEAVFPMADFACANFDLWFDSPLYKSPSHVVQREYPAKLHAVPKTIKTPRLIAAEPSSLQWSQQSVRKFLYTQVHASPINQFVDFRSQSGNGELALAASHSQRHCTIDLSSASDRISCWHVERLFRRSPSLLDACRATRSTYIEQEICRISPRLYKLRKYSTMGNATTFPVQSLFFLAVSLGTLCYKRGLRPTMSWLKTLGEREVRVFGDDIIVPEDCADLTVGALTALGLRVNNAKTFLTGKFRESCGVDAYDGQNVTTVNIMSTPKQTKPGTIASAVSVHNNLCLQGMYRTATYVRKTVESLGRYIIPMIRHGSGSFGWYPDYGHPAREPLVRFNRKLHRLEHRCHSLVAKTTDIPASGSAAFLHFFTEARRIVTSSKSSLSYQGQRAKSSLKLSWVVLQ